MTLTGEARWRGLEIDLQPVGRAVGEGADRHPCPPIAAGGADGRA